MSKTATLQGEENMDISSLIIAKDLTKTYHLGEVSVHALEHVTIDINRGDFVVITGRNGAGKSTLMHNLAVLDRPDSGEIIINGHDVTKLKKYERTELRLQKLGYIFQEYALIAELSALENIMLPAMMLGSFKAAKEKALAMLKQFGLEDHATHLPSQLSGGQQQKIAIARALINDPMILFADEPTANLDSVAAKEVLGIFRHLNRDAGHTIVMVTHEQDETIHANRLVEMADGKVVRDERRNV